MSDEEDISVESEDFDEEDSGSDADNRIHEYPGSNLIFEKGQQCRRQEGAGGRGGWGSAPNPGAASPQEC